MAPFLSNRERGELKKAHKQEHLRRHADRIKAILLLDSGWSYEKVAEALLLDDQTVRNYEKTYQTRGIDGLLTDNYIGCVPKLSTEQDEQLKEHLRKNTYSTAKEIAVYVKQTFQVVYTAEGMVHTLHRLGFVYKKTTPIPGKAEPEKQKEFIECYHRLKNEKSSEDKIFFMDSTHPQHNPMPAYCWIEKGTTKEIPTNTGRERINLNGAIDIESHEVVIREDKSINAQSTIELFKEIEEKNPKASTIYIISDNARYYRAKLVKTYLENSRIELVFLPPYSPNLNLIERVWKFFHEKTLYNIYYDTYKKFKDACLNFFANIRHYKEKLCSLLTENFQIIGEHISKT